MNGRATDLETTMRGLEAGLRVEHIATFSMEECAPDDDADTLLDRPHVSGFDQFPVRDSGHIVGVLERSDDRDGQPVRRRMRPLEEAMLVSAGDPLGTLLPLMATHRYRLVVQQAKIAGLVTQSDLLKLPVRLLAFTKITHLELLMADVIADAFPDVNDWLALLTSGRHQRVMDKIGEAGAARLDPSALEFTDFCDKRDILRKGRKLGNGFSTDLKEVEKLRNTLYHAGDYAKTVEDLQTFILRLSFVDKWIDELEGNGELPE